MKKIFALLLAFTLFQTVCYAEVIHFDMARVENTELKVDLNTSGVTNAPVVEYPDDIPVLEAFPEPYIIDVGHGYNTLNGYLTEIDGVTYWENRTGEKWMPLPVVPLPAGTTTVTENLPADWTPDLFPYNAKDKKYQWENIATDLENYEVVRQTSRQIGKWRVQYDSISKQCSFFVNGTYRVKTDIPFDVVGHANCVRGPYDNVLYWEDDTTFYIKNYNILLSTPKQPFYDALDALEDLPTIVLNDTILGFEEPPVVEQDRVLVPMRFLFEQMGADVDWEGASQTATVMQNGETISFQIGQQAAQVNGAVQMMDVPAKLENDKTMVPIRFLSENLGYQVEWDGDTNTVTITTTK